MATLRFEPELVQAVTDAELEHARRAGDVTLLQRYHAGAEPLYKMFEQEREKAFARFHSTWFFERGWTNLFVETWNEFPELDARAPHLLVLAARLKREEGAVIGRDGVSVCLRVLPLRFANRERLLAFVRHEFLHAADMLDAHFGYQTLGEATLAETNRLADSYHALWCAYVDARLERRHLAPLMDYHAHHNVFQSQFSSPTEQRDALLTQVWNASALAHNEIISLARANSPRGTRHNGARCPLCHFPTFQWASEIAPVVADAIRADFPAWQIDDGACERCVERYAMLVPVE